MMKMLTGFSNREKVCWFDFEMGEDRVVKKLDDFPYSPDNMLYYASSRDLTDVIEEIKYLSATGISHFVIDSAMKIRVPGLSTYEKFSEISSQLSALTSSLMINIYMINQMSQMAERENNLSIKHGNDAEYDADFIFFLLNVQATETKDSRGTVTRIPKVDDAGFPIIDDTVRLLKCTKNRQDERLFDCYIPKSSLLGIKAVEIVYEMD
jgi:hypothetical protein